MNSVAPQPVVSVIIVSWNARKYLLGCLATLNERACRRPMEIIVVDNASHDGSPEAVEAAFPHVTVIRTGANLGFAKANNVGIRNSKGRYLCLVNSDVEVGEGCIDTLVDYCEANPRAGIVGPYVEGGDRKLQRSCRGFPSLGNMFCRAAALDTIFPRVELFTGYAMTHWAHDDIRRVDILSGCFWLARREAVDQVGGLDEGFFMYGEDMDWCRRFRTSGWDAVFVPSARIIHYGGASSSNAPLRFYIEQRRADFQYWRKHHAPWAARAYFLIEALHLATRAVGYWIAGQRRGAGRETARHKVSRSVACLRWMFTGKEPVDATKPAPPRNGSGAEITANPARADASTPNGLGGTLARPNRPVGTPT
jgi:GT2 family glycosyltransferase